jgi:lysophospholipase L1-like esterase
MDKIILGDSNSLLLKLEGFENLAKIGSRAMDTLADLKDIKGGEVIMVGVGVNDAATISELGSEGVIRPSVNEFRSTYTNLVKIAKFKFNSVIVVGPISSTEELVKICNAKVKYSNKDIVSFNSVIEEICKDLDVLYINLLGYFLGKEREMLVDHIHPNQEGVKVIETAIQAKLVRL